MFLSALTFAAALQATPQIALRGYWLGGRSVGDVSELNLPLPRGARRAVVAKPERMIAWRLAPPPKPRFVRDPQSANCKNAAPLPAGGPEALQVQPLSKMPPGHSEFAVQRQVDGCTVAAPMNGSAAVF